MNRAHAAQMLKAAINLDRELGAMDAIVSSIEDEQEKKEYVAALGEIMGLIASKFIFRLFREHPELDTEK
jgi:hypothetical protein